MRRNSRREARFGPPRRGGGAGAFVFVALVLALLVLLVFVATPRVAEATVQLAEDRPGLLRNAAVRDFVRSAVGDAAERPAEKTGASQNFVVEKGDTAAPVARRLTDAGVISRPIVFLLPLYEEGLEDTLQAGTYRVSASMRPVELAQLFQRSVGEQLVLRVIEGWRLSEISAEVQRRFSRITAEDFQRAAVAGRYDYAFLRGLPANALLEGFLFPDTYFFAPDVTAEEIVRTMLDTFQARASDLLLSASERRGVQPLQVVIIASIVEREARARQESPTIASVYWNRLKIGMALQADPTVQYALGSWRELTLDDLKTDSPYNTYLHPGLPPSAICSPGITALGSAAEPATTDYLFFVAKGDGSGEHIFARTVEEHEANRQKYGNK